MAPLAPVRDLLTLDGMPREAMESLLDAAEGFRDVARGAARSLDLLQDRIVANLFIEDSTRTRCSFTLAAKRLGGDTLDIAGSGSSLSKGETLADTARNVEAMGVAAIVVRARPAGAAAVIADAVACPVINAGDGRHAHPTQGLLDVLTLRQRWGSLEGRTIAIVGDVDHSRVARTNVHGMTTLGADVVLVGPPTLVSRAFERIPAGPGRVTVSHDLDAVIDRLDAIMMLRVQFERGSDVTDDYREHFALTVARADRLRAGALVMHPAPINRGLEIDGEVADDPHRSVILEQVTNGVAVRMAVLAHACAP